MRFVYFFINFQINSFVLKLKTSRSLRVLHLKCFSGGPEGIPTNVEHFIVAPLLSVDQINFWDWRTNTEHFIGYADSSACWGKYLITSQSSELLKLVSWTCQCSQEKTPKLPDLNPTQHLWDVVEGEDWLHGCLADKSAATAWGYQHGPRCLFYLVESVPPTVKPVLNLKGC